MLVIQSRSHAYTVDRVATLRDAVARAGEPGRRFHLVDRVVHGLYADALTDVDPERLILVDADETVKSYEALGPLFEALLDRGFRKDATLVVIGGGVVQDIGCFLASVLFRGARWELIPTTLLAQADSCIGSKSSINLGRYKNQIGTFYPPHAVWIVPAVLATLPPDAVRSGVGEMIKLSLLSGPPALDRLTGQLRRHLADPADLGLLATMTMEALAIKQPYIEADELDRGVRLLLNYGHTFGHAFESATHYAIPHGIAVSLGMVAASWCSEAMGLAPAGHAAEIRALLLPWYTPYEEHLVAAGVDAVVGAMRHDKKNTGGRINLVLTHGVGQMERVGVMPDEVAARVTAWFASGFGERPPS